MDIKKATEIVNGHEKTMQDLFKDIIFVIGKTEKEVEGLVGRRLSVFEGVIWNMFLEVSGDLDINGGEQRQAVIELFEVVSKRIVHNLNIMFDELEKEEK